MKAMRSFAALRRCSLTLLVAAIWTSGWARDEASPSDELIPFPARPFLERGMTRESLVNSVGAPSARLSPDVWVYFDFTAVNPRFHGIRVDLFAHPSCDAIVIGFEKDRVSFIRLCNSKPVHEFIARQEQAKAIRRAAMY